MDVLGATQNGLESVVHLSEQSAASEDDGAFVWDVRSS